LQSSKRLEKLARDKPVREKEGWGRREREGYRPSPKKHPHKWQFIARLRKILYFR